MRYDLSSNIRFVQDDVSGLTMAYHTIYGRPKVCNPATVSFLRLFDGGITTQELEESCEGDPIQLLSSFVEDSFILKPDCDEMKILRTRKSNHLDDVADQKTVDRMGLAISDSCNFGCGHCIHFQPTGVEKNILPIYQGTVPQMNMSWEVAQKCIDHYVELMRQQGRTHCLIHFGNAEPLINWRVIQQILEYCRTLDDLTFEFGINTNLVLLTREIAETLKRYRVKIATSLDGTKSANDAIRITKGGQGTYDRILGKFDLLVDIDYPLDGFSTTVTADNYALIDESLIDIAIDRGMTSIAFDYDLIGLVDIPVDERVAKLMSLKRYANQHGIEFFGTWDSAYRNLMTGSLLDESQGFCAAVLGKALEFNVDGSIKVCSHTTTKVGEVGNFAGLFQEGSELLKLIDQRFPGSDAYCSGCAIEGPCGGQCHVTREVVTRSGDDGKLALFENTCDFLRVTTEALIREYLQQCG